MVPAETLRLATVLVAKLHRFLHFTSKINENRRFFGVKCNELSEIRTHNGKYDR